MGMNPEYDRSNEQLAARCRDWIRQSERQNRCIITPFLTPLQQRILQEMIPKRLSTCLWGGYVQAESKRLCMAPYEITAEAADACEIVTLKGTYRLAQRPLTHRDVLGALLHLGVERDQFGDILVQGEDIILFVRKEMALFLELHLTKIAYAKVQMVPCMDVIEAKRDLDWRTASVAAMRLDCLVGACAHVSRSKAVELIKGKCVKVDHLPLEDCKYLCNNNCTVSLRGYGRFAIRASERISRKGKRVIEIGTYR